MIRKISHILIMTLLFISTVGVSVSRHYCRGKLVDVSLSSIIYHSSSDGCTSCMMGKCCRNEHHLFHLNEKYKVPVVTAHIPFFEVLLDVFNELAVVSYFDKQEIVLTNLSAEYPPPWYVASLSGLQVFRL